MTRQTLPSYDGPRAISTTVLQASSNGQSQDGFERRAGTLVLLTVPFAWGSFEPATRYIYSMDPPVPGFVFSVAYYSVAAIALLLATAIASSQKINWENDSPNENSSIVWPTAGGVELGLYLFVGNALQVLGLKTVPSDRAAFLLQLTTIFVPLLQATFARDLSAVSRRTWWACVVALGGVAVISLEDSGMMESLFSSSVSPLDGTSFLSTLSLSSGDLLVMTAAISYSFHCIRLEGYAKSMSAVQLAAGKATTETLCSVMTVVALVAYASSHVVGSGDSFLATFAQESGEEIDRFVTYLSKGFSEETLTASTWLPTIWAILWTGLVTVAYTIYAQSYGQRRVNPATANLIYTFQPICTAIFAWALLGETLGPAGIVGGGLIGVAVLLVTVPQDNS